MKLTSKIAIAVTVATIITGTAAAIFLVTWVRNGFIYERVESQTHEAQTTLDKIDRYLEERLLDMETLSNRLEFKQLVSAAEPSAAQTVAVNAELADYKNLSDHWENITIIDANKRVVASNAASLETQQRLLETDLIATLLNKALSRGDTFYSDVTEVSDDVASVFIVVPIKAISSGQTVNGAVVGQVHWGNVLEILRGVNSKWAYLINAGSYDIGDNLPDNQIDLFERRYADSPAYQRAATPHQDIHKNSLQPGLENNEDSSISTFARESGSGGYKGNGWLLILETPATEALTSARQLAVNIIRLILLCVVFVIVLIVFVFRRLFIRPIQVLGKGIEAITTGQLNTRIQRQSRDELGDLTDSFNNMAHNLQSAYRGLERQTFMTETNRARLVASVNGLKQGFIIINKDLTIELFNDTVAKSFRLEGKGAHMPVDVVLRKFGNNAEMFIKGVQECLVSGRPQEFQNVAYESQILQIYVAPVSDKAATIGAVMLIEDVTEEQLLQRSKDEFFSIASHELRTPLTAIRGNAALIMQYYDEQLKDPTLKEMVTDIHGSSVRLIDIVNDFLDASRLEQGKMRFKYDAVQIDKIIESVIYELAGVSREKNIYLKFTNKLLGALPPVYGDKDRLKQVVYNLTGNALKFTEVGGITIWAEPVGKFLKVFVQDTGNGIPANEQQALFRKFEQASTSTSAFTRDTTRGTGLGLYISKLIMENMGGTVQLEMTEMGKGSIFSFTVPLMNEESGRRSSETVEAVSTVSSAAATTFAAPTLPSATQVPESPKTPAESNAQINTDMLQS